jgi:DNA-binding CsgD family transcriptional regulator/PAS domain-containing protein
MQDLQRAYFADSDLSELIGSIYDAAVAPERWTSVLRAAREFAGGHCAAIFAKNVTGTRTQLFHSDGCIAAERTNAYFGSGGLAPIDPSNTVQVLGNLETAVITSRNVDPEDLAGSRFAKEWIEPQCLIDMVVAPIERRGSWSALFGVIQHERDGLGDETTQERITLLAPHIRRAMSIGDMLGEALVQVDTLRDTIDGLSAGVFLVDAEGRLLHANAAGKSLIGAHHAITTGRDETLRLDRKSMRDLLAGPRTDEPRSVFIEAASGKQLVGHVLPLATGARRFSGIGRNAAAALFVQPAQFDPKSVPGSLADAFGLTPGELRVVLATVRHEGVADIAETLGVAETTVKTHLARIFSKTDTRRQADIVKLVAAFASPLRH